MSSKLDDECNTSKSKASRAPRRTWEEGYQDLKSFAEQNGHCCPKATTLVGRWAANQRKKRSKNELSTDQIQRLDDIGFEWVTQSEKLDEHWQYMFRLLKKFKMENGHTRAKQKEIYRGESLGNWVTSQQSLYRNCKMKEHRKDQLETIGFEWIRDERLVWKDTRPLGKLDDDWNEKFKVLCEYKEKTGDTLVSVGHMAKLEDGSEFDLGAFVTRHRQLDHDGLLRAERREKLERIGFVFAIDIYDAEASNNQKQWDRVFDRLVQFRDKNGDCNVPAIHEEDKELGAWVRVQRSKHNAGELGEKRFHRLDALGFNWDPYQERWKEMVDHLRSYKQKCGHCKVPDSYQTEDGANLGNWVRTVRRSRRENLLSTEKIDELDALGFVWENVLHLHWDIMYNALQKYQKIHGHCRVPQSYKGDDTDNLPSNLGVWVSGQRQDLEKKLEQTGDPIYVERRKKLNELGFDWTLAHISDQNWDTMFEALQKHKTLYGDCRVPYSYKGCESLPRKLGEWVYNQRATVPAKAKEGKVTFIIRKQRLDGIDFLWEDNVAHFNWMKMFERLQQYHAKHGDCFVPSGYDDKNREELPTTLASWVRVQKSVVCGKAESGHPVYVERKQLLDSLNFEFDDVFEVRWRDMYERLKRYHAIHGNCRVPTTYNDDNGGPGLSSWVRNQKDVIEKAQSGDQKYLERKKLLEFLGFEFEGPSVADEKWLSMLQLLKSYVEEHKHCSVPYSYCDKDSGSKLGEWCHEQRKNIPMKLASTNTIADYEERKKMLDSLGFDWAIEFEKDKRWKYFFERLKEFKERHGHCYVPSNHQKEDNESSLYSWVNRQYRKLPQKVKSGDPVYVKRKQLLDSIGFDWKRIFDNQWEQMYASLVQYKEKHGNCRVSYRGKGAVDGPTGQLGIWVYKQRTDVPSKASSGDPVYVERKKRLDDIGFEWLDVHTGKWETMFAGLERFHKEHGHCRVKRDYVDKKQPLPANLGSWSSTQRKEIPERIKQGDEVAIERKRRLDALGFVWQTRAPPKTYTRNGKFIGGHGDLTVKSSNSTSNVQSNKRARQYLGGLSKKPTTSTPINNKASGGISCHNIPKDRSRKRPRQVVVNSPNKSNSPTPINNGAPGPDGAIVDFPVYSGDDYPSMGKSAFGQYKSRHRKAVKESLTPTERTKKRIIRILQERWHRLSDKEKAVYRGWAEWDEKRYERDLMIFNQRKRKNDASKGSLSSKKYKPTSDGTTVATIPRKGKSSKQNTASF